MGEITPIVILTETPEDNDVPGRHRRYLSVKAWLEASTGRPIQNRSISSVPATGKLSRAARAIRWLNTDGQRDFVVCGLSAPHMLLLAIRLARSANVVYDSCDSWLLQSQARRAQGGASRFLSIAGVVLTFLSPRFLAVSYISGRDAQADIRIARRQHQILIAQFRDPTLAALPPVEYPITRLVVVADAGSFHTRSSLSEFLPELAVHCGAHGLSLELYGKLDRLSIPPGVEVRGWAPNLSDVYSGNTAVFVTNVSGSGVPNKVIEANTSGRPVLIHSSLSYLKDELSVPAFWFEEKSDIGSALRSLVESSTAQDHKPGSRRQSYVDQPSAHDLFSELDDGVGS